MPAALVADQELVVHLFAPLRGPHAQAAYRQVSAVWQGCRDVLGMTLAIGGTALPDLLPPDPAELPGHGAVAAQEDAEGDRQGVLRVVGGVLNLSLVFAAPRSDAANGVAGAGPRPGWARSERQWAATVARAADGTMDAFLGEARLYLGKVPGTGTGPVTADPELARGLATELRSVPGAESAETSRWWAHGTTVGGGLALWEPTRRQDTAVLRRFLVLGPESADLQISTWTWSDGGTSVPAFARYLLNAAKIRHQVRLWEAAQRPRWRAERVDDAFARVHEATTDASAHEGEPDAAEEYLARLRDEHAELVAVVGDLADMRRTVEAARGNIVQALGAALPPPGGHDPINEDLSLADWFTEQLGADIRAVDAGRERAGELRALAADALDRLTSRRPATVPAPGVPAGRAGPASSRRNVFVVHGRDGRLRTAVFDFLRALDLRPLEWESLVRATGSTAPFLGDVVAQAPAQAQAAVVILSPDDVVHLHPELHTANEYGYETAPTCQPRPNVLLELGMVLMAYPERTVILEFGRLRPIADLAGRNSIRFDGSTAALGKVAERLKSAGCAVDDTGADWSDTRRFAALTAYDRKPPG